MKNCTLYCIVLLLGGFLLNAQTRSLPELLSELDKNHMGAVTDVFSAEEIQVLRTHFDAINEPLPNNRGGGFETFAPENVNGYYGHFNSGDPANYMMISMSGTADFEGAGVVNPFTGNPLVVDNSGNVYEVDRILGSYVLAGTITPPAGQSITGLEMNPETGVVYAISTDGAGNSSVFIVDDTNFEISQVQPISSTLPICLGIDLQGNGYFLDIDSDTIFRVNLTTGVVSLLGPAGFDASFGQGMGLGEDGEMYLAAFNNDTFRSELRWVNTKTGATTLVGPIGSSSPGGTTQFGWMSVNTENLSVSDNASNGFTIYPNPVANTLFLETTFDSSSYQIYNITGALLIDQVFTESIDVSSLAAGAYLISVKSVNGTVSTQKFIKN